MLKVRIPEDLPMRVSDSGTWVEAGEYRLIRLLPRDRLLIDLKVNEPERMLTIVRSDEIEQII